ncbi:hypothetical protein [Serratia ureilytica]|uniref:hypothetical protein n=1 Tax=Serratia ureilytica TaxID=300181 RepID=UPI001F353C4D|nr:hypothetical protein [Serratia ureilytica]
MNEVISTEVNGVEFDPRYSEIEFTLSEYDSQTDPLNAVDNARDINWHAIREQSASVAGTVLRFTCRAVVYACQSSYRRFFGLLPGH